MNRSERRAAAQAQRPQVQEAQPPGLHQRAFLRQNMIDDPIKYVRDRSTEDADAWAQFCGGIGDGPDAPYPPPGHRHPGGCVAGANQELRVKFAEAIAYAIKEHTPGFDAAAFIRESVA